MASSIRTFVALPLPTGLIRSIGGLIRGLSGRFPEYRWQEGEQLHVTLNFLGDVPDARVGDVCLAVEQTVSRHAAFTCSLGAMGAFPKPGRPRILWLGIDEGQAELVRLHHDLTDALEELDIEPERKRYRPHLTLGRIRNQQRWSDSMVEMLASGETPELQADSVFEADEIVVYSSFLESTGPVYTPMARVSLPA